VGWRLVDRHVEYVVWRPSVFVIWSRCGGWDGLLGLDQVCNVVGIVDLLILSWIDVVWSRDVDVRVEGIWVA
jgi:hypothetical protein